MPNSCYNYPSLKFGGLHTSFFKALTQFCHAVLCMLVLIHLPISIYVASKMGNRCRNVCKHMAYRNIVQT